MQNTELFLRRSVLMADISQQPDLRWLSDLNYFRCIEAEYAKSLKRERVYKRRTTFYTKIDHMYYIL